jgi:hypothetical protein
MSNEVKQQSRGFVRYIRTCKVAGSPTSTRARVGVQLNHMAFWRLGSVPH